MPEFDTDTLLPPKHGVMTPFAKFAWTLIGLFALLLSWEGVKKFKPDIFRSPDALIESARQAMHAKKWDQAAQDLVKAKKLAPDNLKVTKAIVDLLKLTGTNAAELQQMIQKLNSQGGASPELQLLMAQTLFRLGRFSEARQWHDALPESLKRQTEALELMAGVLNAEGRTQEAEEFIHRSVLAMPEGPVKEFKLAMEGIRHPFSSVSQNARQTLRRIAHSPSELALQAAAQLASLSDLTTADYKDLLKIIDEHTDKNLLPIRLEVISSLARLQPDQRGALFTEEVTRFRQRQVPGIIPASSISSPKNSEVLLDDDLRILGRWLAKEKQPELLQQLVPLKGIQESSELFTCLAWALSEDQQWNKLQELLAGRKPALNPILISIWHAVIEGHLHPESNESSKLLSGAIEGAAKSKDSVLLLAAALAAEQFNEQGIALAAYQAIANFDEKKAVAALEQAFAKAELLKDTTAMINAVSKLHVLKPHNRAYAARLLYLQLICGRGLEVASLEVVSMHDSVGNEQALHELLQALAAYRFSDAECMKQHLQRIEKAEEFSAGQRAAYAGLLSKAGKTSIAFQIAEKISESQLLPEELELLKVAL